MYLIRNTHYDLVTCNLALSLSCAFIRPFLFDLELRNRYEIPMVFLIFCTKMCILFKKYTAQINYLSFNLVLKLP